MSGAIKLRDGLFFGDQMAAEDLEFVVANKVTGIVNCACRQVRNHFESIGVEYLSYPWVDNDSQVILDIRGVVMGEISLFIEDILDKGESVLVHSVRGQSRSVTVLTAFLMKQYLWGLNKALEYIQSRKEDIAIKPAFHRQLLSFERRLSISKTLSNDWSTPPPQDMSDHLIMYNTFMNSRNRRQVPSSPAMMNSKQSTQKICWSDHHMDDRSKLEKMSDASGNVFPIKTGGVKSILKKVLLPSPASTAPSTPLVRPSTPTRQVPSHGVLKLGSGQPGPVRVGRSLISPQNIFPLRTPVISNHHVRPPSPMVSHGRIVSSSSQQRQPSPSLNKRPIIRPPSPARSERGDSSQSIGLSIRPFGYSTGPVDFTKKPPPLVSQLRRAPSPMTTALQGSLRPQSAPQWRMR